MPELKLVPRREPDAPRAEHAWLLAMAATVAALHALTNGRYGLHRDELQFLSDARHLAWGFVAYPPFTPLVERGLLEVFGLSLVWLRMASVLAQAAVVVLAGLMAFELGGGRLAQLTTAFCVATAPLALFQGTEFQYTSFDNLWWVLIAYLVVRWLKSEEPRWCLAIGATFGVGLMTKYSIVFLLAGLMVGLAVSPARRWLANRWFWAGAAVALALCLPNVVWQARHGYISYHFLQYIHARDVRWGRAEGFIPKQFWINTNLFAAPLWVAGLVALLRSARYRALAVMYLLPFFYLLLSKGRFYYLGAAYPALLAMGAVVGERWVAGLARRARGALLCVLYTSLTVAAVYGAANVIPLATSGPLYRFALEHNGDLREEIGWPELVRTVAEIRDRLPAEERAQTGILVGNYGEQGAIEMFGPAYHLPAPISMTNSAWLRGYPSPPPTKLIVLGFSREGAEKAFDGCTVVGHNGDVNKLKNEESEWHPEIFLCGPPKLGWPKFWEEYQSFG